LEKPLIERLFSFWLLSLAAVPFFVNRLRLSLAFSDYALFPGNSFAQRTC